MPDYQEIFQDHFLKMRFTNADDRLPKFRCLVDQFLVEELFLASPKFNVRRKVKPSLIPAKDMNYVVYRFMDLFGEALWPGNCSCGHTAASNNDINRRYEFRYKKHSRMTKRSKATGRKKGGWAWKPTEIESAACSPIGKKIGAAFRAAMAAGIINHREDYVDLALRFCPRVEMVFPEVREFVKELEPQCLDLDELVDSDAGEIAKEVGEDGDGKRQDVGESEVVVKSQEYNIEGTEVANSQEAVGKSDGEKKGKGKEKQDDMGKAADEQGNQS